MSRFLFVPAVLLLLLCPAYPQTSETLAVLRPSGAVKVNGSPATHSTVVTDGDRIDTGTNSSAFLLLSGQMITLGAGSSVLYKTGGVLRTGGAKITTVTCQGSSCTTSSALLGSGAVNTANPKKKCISPKKDKDKECDD
jgi:hypothetical protein